MTFGIEMMFKSLGLDKDMIMGSVKTVTHIAMTTEQRLANIEKRQLLIMAHFGISDDGAEIPATQPALPAPMCQES